MIPIVYKIVNGDPESSSGINSLDNNNGNVDSYPITTTNTTVTNTTTTTITTSTTINTTTNNNNNHRSNPGLTTREIEFEVVWRNLIYYHKFNNNKNNQTNKSSNNNNNNKIKKSAVKSKLKNPKKNTILSNDNGRKNGDKFNSNNNNNNNNNISSSSTFKNIDGQPRPTLNNISGSFQSGQMTAIMGPSGAGKTVFLNYITGRLNTNKLKCNSGDIVIHGVKSIRIGFVEQFDQLLAKLTVRETLLFASRIKNASRYYLNHNKIVENVLQRLNLCDCRDSYACDCSNGQRKRLSIGIELCFNADILILDEPTTGLDAVTGFQIMNTLKMIIKRVSDLVN